jgi:LysM repeat protein
MMLRAKTIIGAVGFVVLSTFGAPALAVHRAAAGNSAPDDDSSLTEILAGLEGDAELLAEEDAQAALERMWADGWVARTPAVEDHDWLRDMERVRDWERLLLRRRALSRIRLDDDSLLARDDTVTYDIPLADHPLVDTYVKHFTGRGRWFFAKWLARADRYLPIMQPILSKAGVPRDLVYVAMVESGFSARAVSVAAACGYWQFIRSTGKLFGMRMDVWIDERRDFVRATEAAAAYMKQLHEQFGDWHLAWAGYNAGGGRVRRALARYRVEDYWTLIGRKRALAKETRHYVPKIVAAAIISKSREKYGFGDVEPLPPLLYDDVEVDDAVDLRVVARKLGVSLTRLRELNPALLQDVTPPGREHILRVPRGRGPETSKWLASLPASKRLTYRHHRVKGGDTLWKIAARYNSSIEAIRDFNRVRNPRALRVGSSLIVPTLRSGPRAKVYASAPVKRAARVAQRITKAVSSASHHVVAPGDTLWSISRKYDTTVGFIKAKNGLRSSRIVVGEKLRIH